MLVKVKIRELNQHAGTVRVEYNGQIHTGRWNNNAEVYNLGEGSDQSLLKGVMASWGKQEPVRNDFEIEDTELKKLSDGWWGPE